VDSPASLVIGDYLPAVSARLIGECLVGFAAVGAENEYARSVL
jgi:hypothetical protein